MTWMCEVVEVSRGGVDANECEEDGTETVACKSLDSAFNSFDKDLVRE